MIPTPDLTVDQCNRAIRHVATLFRGGVAGGPKLYQVSIPPATANPNLVVELADNLPSLDQYIVLDVAVGDSGIQTSTRPPLFYMTGALGFVADAQSSFETTLKATLDAYRTGGRMTTFPAPPRPPVSPEK